MVTIEEIDNWIRSQPNLIKYSSGSTKFKRILYQTRYVARKRSECIENQKADLDLLVSKVLKRRRATVCNYCRRKKCAPSCGKEDYALHYTTWYWASDSEGGWIFIDISPFYKGEIKELHKDKIYRVKGEIHEYRERMYIIPDEIFPIEEFSNDSG